MSLVDLFIFADVVYLGYLFYKNVNLFIENSKLKEELSKTKKDLKHYKEKSEEYFTKLHYRNY